MDPNEIRRQGQAKLTEARAIAEVAKSEQRDLTDAETKQVEDLTAAGESLLKRAAAFERLEKAEAEARQSLGRQTTPNPLPHQDDNNVGTRHQYSVLKALRQADPSQKSERLDGLELEVHQELLKRRGKGAKGVLIPWDLPIDQRQARAFAVAFGLERRDLTTTTGAGAVFEQHGTMIELLRVLPLSARLGVRILSGLSGNFSLPRQSGGGTAYWVTEGNAVTESNQTINSVDFSPSTVGAFTDYSRAFLHQTSVDAEMFVREDLMTVIAIELDRVSFNGSGSGAQPTGIIPDANVNVVAIDTNGGAPTWAKILEMEYAVEVDNALLGTIHFVTTPAGKSTMKRTTKIASSDYSDFLWERDNSVNGYAAHSSNQLPANLAKGSGTNLSAAILGNFADAIWGFWGGLDVLVDPYTGGTAGNVRIIELQDADFQLRHPESFAVIKDMVTT